MNLSAVEENTLISSDSTELDATNQFLIYQTEDGRIKIETHFENETIWLSIEQIGELYGKARSTINEHIVNIYKEGELEKEGSIRKIGISDFSTKPTNFYNLDVIISVGYRVKSHRGVHFRKWATALIKEYLIKGFAMNDDLLKHASGGNYFDELLSRIRDIRSSEKVFWRKVLDIYATSIDYDSKTDLSILFFKTVQNKMHWASHGETAAETIYNRVDANREFMGLTNFQGEIPTKKETEIAKNYLSENELDILNRMVNAYLDIAEIQALDRVPMYMKDWLLQLDNFLKLTNKNILTHTGSISRSQALDKAHSEYTKYREKIKNRITSVERDFIKQLEQKTEELKS